MQPPTPAPETQTPRGPSVSAGSARHRDPRSHTRALTDLCRRGVELARRAGADQAEVCAEWSHDVVATVQQNDLDGLADTEETTLGVRVLVDGRPGFATANRAGALDGAIEDAIAIARATAPDPWAGFYEGDGVEHTAADVCDDLVAWASSDLAQRLMARLRQLRAAHATLTVDSAELQVSRSVRALASSQGVLGSFATTRASGSIFGMAIDGGRVGSFSYDGDVVATLDALAPALDAAFDRFVVQALDALRAGKGESFRGPIVLPPSAAASLLLSPLIGGLSAAQLRKGKSPFADKLGERIAHSGLTVVSEGLGLPGMPTCPFDRDGAARRRSTLVDAGVLQGFLYDHYEARAAGTTTTGSALGGASHSPYVGVAACSDAPGPDTAAALETEERCVVVPRFAGTTDRVTGDFSGVVKGGYLVVDGERRPIHETTIAGNVYACLDQITGISAERRTIYGSTAMPTLRIADVSITAG